MRFSLFSVVILLFIGTAVFVETARGIKRGFARAALGLTVVLLSILGALVATGILSGLVARPLSEWLAQVLSERIDVVAEYRTLLPELDGLLTAIVDMLLGPFIFLILFLILRGLLRMLVSAISGKPSRPVEGDLRRRAENAALGSSPCPDYEGENSSWFRRHDRTLGGAVGAIAGFLVALCLLTPLSGLLSVADTVYDGLNDMEIKWRVLKLDGEKLDRSLSPFVDDAMMKTVGILGGNLLYDAASRADLYGEAVVLRDEVEACMVIVADGNRVIKILGKNGNSTSEQSESLKTFGDHLDESRVMCVVTTDFIVGASARWLENRTFLTVRRPSCGEFVDPLMNEVLYFLYQNANPDYVSDDLNTMLGIYFIVLEYGLIDDPDSDTLMGVLEDGAVLNQIYAELEKNPRMSWLVDDLTEATMSIMANSIQAVGLPDNTYNELMDDLAEAVTLVNGMSDAEFSTQVNTMTQYAVHYANQYDVKLPVSVAQMGVTAMMNQFAGRDQVSGVEMKAYIEYFQQNGGMLPGDASNADGQPNQEDNAQS